MKLIIAGSRGWWPSDTDIDAACWYLGHSLLIENPTRIHEVVCGMAPGVDMAGRRWAMNKGLTIKDMPADWERLGRRAGKIRNQAMAEYADEAIVFWDGDSSGSTNMHAWMSVLNKPSKVFTKNTVDLARQAMKDWV